MKMIIKAAAGASTLALLGRDQAPGERSRHQDRGDQRHQGPASGGGHPQDGNADDPATAAPLRVVLCRRLGSGQQQNPNWG